MASMIAEVSGPVVILANWQIQIPIPNQIAIEVLATNCVCAVFTGSVCRQFRFPEIGIVYGE